MQINIKTSEANKDVIQNLTRKLGEGIPENVIARIALAFSLQEDKKFTLNESQIYDSKGKEYKDHILFDAQNRDFYIALICQHYGIYKSDENIPKYIKLHIDHGLEMLNRKFSSNEYSVFDLLGEYIENGCKYLVTTETTFGHVTNKNQNITKSHFSGLLKIQVGRKIDTNEPIYLSLNNNLQYNNCHTAIAGNSGTGKTQFALDFISQICDVSNRQVNYIYLDFKGLKPDDQQKMQPFFKNTDTTFIDIPHRPFPINPLMFIDNINEQNKEMGIDKFVDVVCKNAPQLGVKQKQFLRTATREAFNDQHGGTYPTLSQIKENLDSIYKKSDSLTQIIDDLSRYTVFANDTDTDILNKNFYLSLSGALPIALRFTSLFLIINYIYNVFMNMSDSPTEDDRKAIRYVIMIDEAHVLFKEKKYQEILEKMLREMRSKGVAIVLLSQGIEEFNQKGFDFSSLCNISFLLDINDKNNTPAMEKFLGLTKPNNIVHSMSKISRGQAISNIKEFTPAKLFIINQYWQNH